MGFNFASMGYNGNFRNGGNLRNVKNVENVRTSVTFFLEQQAEAALKDDVNFGHDGNVRKVRNVQNIENIRKDIKCHHFSEQQSQVDLNDWK